MPIISPFQSNPLIDGRQSSRAMEIRRGVQLLLSGLGASHVPELTLASGRRADLTAIFRDGSIWIIEIKSSIEDMKADTKWHEYYDYCDRLYFATLGDVPESIFPDQCGFIVADGRGAEVLRQCEDDRLSAARRKTMLLRFGQFAADRLFQAEIAAKL